MDEARLEAWADAYLDAWQRHDVGGILSFHTDDTVFTSVAFGRHAVGRAAVAEAISSVFMLWPDIHFRTRRRYLTPQVAVFEATLDMTQSGAFPVGDDVVPPNGRRVSVEACDVFAFRDGLVARKDTYLDGLGYLAAMRKAAGVAA